MPRKRKADGPIDLTSSPTPTGKKLKAVAETKPMATSTSNKSSKRAVSSSHPPKLNPQANSFTPNRRDHPQPTALSPGFYQSGSGNNSNAPSTQNLTKVFDQYRDNPKDTPDKIGIEGAQKYLTDLHVELDELAHLALCDLLQCPSIGEFDREPFIAGWREVSSHDKPYDTVPRQTQYISTIRKKLVSDPAYFKQVYRNAFKIAKPEGQRSVPMDSALDFWGMFFGEGKGGMEWASSSNDWLEMWCEYYKSKVKRPVNKDLWNMVGELVTKTKESGGETLEWWNEDGAWPMAIDEFVAHVKDRRKVNGSGGDNMDIS